MRLTLRTMLAYLDDVLEPADAEELGKKIEESEFATGLVQRLRSSMQRLRLAAPDVNGKGTALDSNTVAEYLDNTLPPDRVPEFEKMCLEAEVNLAEVAACHQILTLVLGEPADVSAATRERMYRIGTAAADESSPSLPVGPPANESAATTQRGASSAAGAAASSAAADAPADTGKPDAPQRQKPDVPDYLKSDSKLRLWPIAITLVLALLLVGAVVMALGLETVTGWFGGGSDTTVADADTDTEKDSGRDDPQPPATTGTQSAPGDVVGTEGADTNTSTTPPLRQPAGLAPDTIPGTTPPGGTPPGGTAPGGTAPGTLDDSVIGRSETVRTLPGDGGSELPVIPPVPGPGGEPVVPDDGTEPEMDTPPGNGATAPGPDELAARDLFDDPLVDEPEVPGPAADEDAVDVGRFISEQEILIRHDAENGEWHRVPPRDTLASGQRLLALPTFRPQILLDNNVQLTLDGPTDIRLLPPDEAGVRWLDVKYGRLLLIAAGKPATPVGLQMGERRGTLTFGDADSTAAVEVRPFQQPGSDPEAAPPHIRANLYATSGSVQWQQSDGAAEAVAAGQQRTFVDNIWAETMAVEAFPKWVAQKDISDIDRRASIDLEAELTKDDGEVSLRLYELSEHRRPEVRSLAIRCGGYLDQFEPFVFSLKNQLQRSFWDGQFDALTDAVQRDPETAALVRQTFEKNRNADAEDLYRLLWGFSVQDLEEDGWDARLVDYLENDSMDFRVLAIENLRRITGRTLYFRADNSADRNSTHIARWRDLLDDGDIRYETPPVPLPDTVGGGAPAAES